MMLSDVLTSNVRRSTLFGLFVKRGPIVMKYGVKKLRVKAFYTSVHWWS